MDYINQKSAKKRIVFIVVTVFISFIIAIFIGELFLSLFYPQPYMYPRYQYSSKYKRALFPNCQMVEACPGKYKFTYTINEYGYRGAPIPILGNKDNVNIVVLGDSNSFGAGVNDGQEYAAVLSKKLGGKFNVINLSVGGWGLTQEIRRYYEFGMLYEPEIVILQFGGNDPADNLLNPVTKIENGKFAFYDIKRNNQIYDPVIYLLSRSIVQKSQIYSLIRQVVYSYLFKRSTNKIFIEKTSDGSKVPLEQSYYCSLLERFAKDLSNKGVKLIMISCNGHLKKFFYIEKKVHDLDSEGLLDYREVEDWFKGVESYGTPEGHMWGKLGHKIIGEKLAELIKSMYADK